MLSGTVVLYGVPGKYRDVSEFVLRNCASKDGKSLVLPGSDIARARVLGGDPVPCVVKHLLVVSGRSARIYEQQTEDTILHDCIGSSAPFPNGGAMLPVAISLGSECQAAVESVARGLRQNREGGYKTCPFDLCHTNLNGVIACLNDNLDPLCDPQYLKLIPCVAGFHIGQVFIHHTKYNFIFNHESPGHVGLHVAESWPLGKDHFILNNFEHFIARYKARIENFRNYVNSGLPIRFVLSTATTENSAREADARQRLNQCIKSNYPTLQYTTDYFAIDRAKQVIYHQMMFVDANDSEMLRLSLTA